MHLPNIHRILPLGLALAAILLGAATVGADGDTQGFLYGKITTRSDKTYEGRIHWNDEEDFWGDFFNSTKEDRPYIDEVPRRHRRQPLRIFGVTIGISYHTDEDRGYVARFGDIRTIEVTGGDDAVVTMKSGTEYEIEGGSNDLGEEILIWDHELGEVELDWRRIDIIEFLPAPADLRVPARRLYGTVKTLEGEFRGFIQWDQDESLTSHELDGDAEDGRMAIEMGRIRSIERRSSRSSRVTLESGRVLVMDGTNDVDDDNRGIYVDDPRYGRVSVSWDAFERVDFSDPGSNGPAYADFAPGKPLRGTVTDEDGKKYRGRLIYDVDESESWELLTGEWRDIEYNVPFALIAAIIPKGRDASRVVLRSGEELVLEGTTDVGEENAGIMILDDGDETYVPWEEVERIDFEE